MVAAKVTREGRRKAEIIHSQPVLAITKAGSIKLITSRIIYLEKSRVFFFSTALPPPARPSIILRKDPRYESRLETGVFPLESITEENAPIRCPKSP